MTMLPDSKPLKRETASQYRRRPLIVRLYARHMELSERGKRRRVAVDYAAIYELALKLQFRKDQAERLATKKTRGARKGGHTK
jgi:hypothetical protein